MSPSAWKSRRSSPCSTRTRRAKSWSAGSSNGFEHIHRLGSHEGDMTVEEIAIIGAGLHPWGKFPEKFWTNMASDAVNAALTDAGIQWKDVKAVVSGSQNWGGRKGIYAGTYVDEVMGYTGVPTINVNNACATGGTCITVAAAMVASGYADIVLAVAADKSAKGFFPFLPPYHEEPVPADDTMRWLMGLPNPIYWALECRKKMIKYGITDEHLAQVKVATSKHGALNPLARYRKEFTLEEVLASPMVTDPLRLFEICATSDGAGAVVLCSACLLYTSDAADDLLCVDLGGRRI